MAALLVALAGLLATSSAARASFEEPVGRWADCADIAGCLGLEAPGDVEVALPLNLVFIGFDGDGNLGLNISEATLEHWFGHLESLVPHLLVPTAAASGAPSARSRLAVAYRYRLNILKLGGRVAELVHRLLEANLRPEAAAPAALETAHAPPVPKPRTSRLADAERASASSSSSSSSSHLLYQVDAFAMETGLDALRAALGLAAPQAGYTLFVLNPQRAPSGYGQYGYRAGYSDAELALLKGDALIGRYLQATDARSATDAARSAPAAPPATDAAAAGARRAGAQRVADALERARRGAPAVVARAPALAAAQRNASRAAAHAWAASQLDGRPGADGDARLAAALERSAAPRGLSAAPPLDGLRAHALAAASHGGARARAALAAAYAGRGASEECLSDVWLGAARLGWLDLSAGPFHWGPIVGGEGVRTAGSLPDTHSLLAVGPEAVGAGAALDDRRGGEHAARADVEPPSAEQLASELAVLAQMVRGACAAGGVAADADAGCARMRRKEAALADYARATAADERAAEAASAGGAGARAAANAALGGSDSAALARRRRWAVARRALRAADAAADGGGEIAGVFVADGAVAAPVARLLAQLGAALDAAARHALTPASAPLPVAVAAAARLNFQIYHLTRAGAPRPRASGGVDVARLREGLAQLALPSQTVTYGYHHLGLRDDGALAGAHARARVSSLVPSLSVDGVFAASRRTYLDSRVLSAALRHAGARGEADATAAAPRAPRDADAAGDGAAAVAWLRGARLARAHSVDVPVFVFETGGAEEGEEEGRVDADDDADGADEGAPRAGATPPPVFLDRFFPAKAVDGFVLVAASAGGSHGAWRSHLACNGRQIRWDLNNPIRHALAAAAHLVGGVLPAHVGMSEAHGRADASWLWAVGCSALAHASRADELGQIQQDLVARNQLAALLDESVAELGAVGVALRATRVSPGARDAARAADSAARRVPAAIARVQTVQGVVADFMGALALADAHAAIAELDMALDELRALALAAVDEARARSCAGIDARALGDAPEGEAGVWLLAAGMAAAAAAIFAARFRTPARSKPKLN